MRDPLGTRPEAPVSPAPDADARELPSTPPPRRSSERPLADAWRDVLLALALDLPLEAGPAEVVERFLDGAAVLLPHLALGACVITEPGERPFVSVRLPPGSSDAMQRDPTRLFPILREERVLPLDDASTFHVAAQEVLPPLDLQIAERAALVLARSLTRSRGFRRATGSARNLERLQAHMIQAEKLASLGQIVAGVVHELNNPLTSISVYADYLVRRLGGLGDKSDVEKATKVVEGAARIQKLTRDLMSYARPSGEPEWVSINEVVRQALTFCEHVVKRAEADVQLELADELPKVHAIRAQLHQVLINLVTNACHALTAPGGRVMLTTRLVEGGRAVRISVADDGVGIPSIDRDRVFEPFFTTKKDGKGTGLGLSIVKNIVEGHGGTVTFESGVEVVTTTFVITLPLQKESVVG
jgi:signal transduction histidine kinase